MTLKIRDYRRTKGARFYVHENPLDADAALGEPAAAGGDHAPSIWCPRGWLFLTDVPMSDTAGKESVAELGAMLEPVDYSPLTKLMKPKKRK